MSDRAVQDTEQKTVFERALENLGLVDTYIPASGIPIPIIKEMYRIHQTEGTSIIGVFEQCHLE